MRIGELAQMAGTTARAVRHYHRVGVLPEPARRANGYREYGVGDLARVLRIRWLLGAGLTLQEAATALSDGPAGVADQLADALRRTQEERARLDRQELLLRELLSDAPSGRSPSAVAADVDGALDAVAGIVGPQTAVMRAERTAVDLLAHAGRAGTEAQDVLASAYGRISDDARLTAAMRDLSARFEALTGADPQTASEDIEAAAALLESVLAAVGVDAFEEALVPEPEASADDDGDWPAALFPDPAHRAVLELVMSRRAT